MGEARPLVVRGWRPIASAFHRDLRRIAGRGVRAKETAHLMQSRHWLSLHRKAASYPVDRPCGDKINLPPCDSPAKLIEGRTLVAAFGTANPFVLEDRGYVPAVPQASLL